MERISEIEGLPMIGRYYLVPCMMAWPIDIPIIGPAHGDAELGVPEMHYHYDFRFINKRELSYYFDKAENLSEQLIKAAAVGPNIIVEKKRKCLRQMPEFPLYLERDGQKVYPPWRANLEATYQTCVIKPDCLRCPHRGMPLNGLPQDKDGNVVCSGHGLRWNLNTGRLVSRL